MENERKRILKLVENGAITAEEAIVLLEALPKDDNSNSSDTQASQSTPESFHDNTTEQEQGQQSTKSSFDDEFNSFNNKDFNKKLDDFMNGLKKDFSQVSNRFMGLMNTTFTKMKDFEFPFGEKIEFQKTYTFEDDEIKGVEIEIPSGNVNIKTHEQDQFLVEATVKYSKLNNEGIKNQQYFEDQFIKVNDGKLLISSPIKLAQIQIILLVPKKEYDVYVARLLNGGVTITGLNTKLLKLKTYNGAIKVSDSVFQNADIQSGNGSIELRNVQGEDLEAQTVNGRIYIDGELQEVEGESVNGSVVVTTTSEKARKIKARTVAGAVEMYIPKTLSLYGQVTTNLGKADVNLEDVEMKSTENQLLVKTLFLEKMAENENVLKLYGESRTGNIVIRYNLL